MNTATLTGTIKAKAALVDPARYGRSDRSAMSRWFWEIDKVLLLMIAALIGIGLIAVAAASPAAADRYSGGSVRVNELFFFYRQIMWIAVSMPVMNVEMKSSCSWLPAASPSRFSASLMGRALRYGRVVVTHNGPLTPEKAVWGTVLRSPRG